MKLSDGQLERFDREGYQWHQDYGTWKNDDWMPESRAMNVAIFLDDVNDVRLRWKDGTPAEELKGALKAA